MKFDADLVIIGAGSAGLSVAAGAVQMAARVVLIEGGEMGTGAWSEGFSHARLSRKTEPPRIRSACARFSHR